MNIIKIIKKLKIAYKWFEKAFILKEEFGSFGKNSILQYPTRIYCPEQVFIGNNVKLSSGLNILNAPTEKIIIKDYCVFAANCTLVPNSHTPTVTIPQFLLGACHVNDKTTNIIIDEDVWLGTGVIIMPGVHVGRGCVVGAGSIVTKDLPPYALAVGSPARIVKAVFTVEQILAHEKVLYAKKERLTRTELEENDKKFFKDKKTYGTDQGINEDVLHQINQIKELFRYIEPNIH